MKVSTLIITSKTNHWTNSRSKWWGLKVLLKGAWELHTSYRNALLYKLWKLPILHHTHAFHNVHSVCSGISLHLWPNFLWTCFMRRSLTPIRAYFCLLPGLSSIGSYIAMQRAVVGTRPLLTIVHQPHPFWSVHNYDRRERTRTSRCSGWSKFHSRNCLTASYSQSCIHRRNWNAITCFCFSERSYRLAKFIPPSEFLDWGWWLTTDDWRIDRLNKGLTYR